jgi:hypothetical protein
MRTNQRVGRRTQFLLRIALLAGVWASTARGQEPVSAQEQSESAAGYKQFLDRVHEYASLHKSIESTLPALKSTDLPEMITGRQQALARKIREARANAKRGDIFTESATKAFRRTIRAEFRGPHGKGARATIRQGEPLTKIHLHVNEPYPDGVPFTTVPPSLLHEFPKLPEQVVTYRIVGHDLILLDVDANLVLDRIPEIIP